MKSPFPGVDPFLESQNYWEDFHSGFIPYLRDALVESMPDDYEVRMGERVHLISVIDATLSKSAKPDVSIAQTGGFGGTSDISSVGAVATLEPATVPLPIDEEIREAYIKILHRPERNLVTVIELLSPSNKQEPGRNLYLAKRNELLAQPVHVVELDLLLGGRRLPLDGDYPDGDYFALVSRAEKRFNCDVYHWSIRDPLPTLPIPLRAPDPDVRVDLAAVFNLTYERGRYLRSVDYGAELGLAVGEVDRAWIATVAGKVQKNNR